MNPPYKPTLNSIRQNGTFGANGQFEPIYSVNFTVGPHGPFTVQIPGDKFSSQAVIAAMQNVADQINAIPTGA